MPIATANSEAEIVQRLLTLLGKVPTQDRTRFARAQLAASHQATLRAFDAIPAHRRTRAVLYLSTNSHAREARLAKAARLAGWDPYLVCNGHPKYDANAVFNHTVEVPDLISQVLLSWAFPGRVVHGFALRGDHIAPHCILKRDRFVVDLYDTGEGSLLLSPELVSLEKLGIEHSDGITHRDLRLGRLRHHRNYKLPPHNILIHDPIEPQVLAAPETESNSEIHVISTGWIGTGDNSLLRTIRALTAGGIHVHIYFNPFQDPTSQELSCYRELASCEPKLHIHKQVYGDEYWSELRKYHFGLAISEKLLFGEDLLENTRDAFETCGSSRVADYIQAGIGVIYSPQMKFIKSLAQRYAATAVPAGPELLDNPHDCLAHAYSQRRSRDCASITTTGISPRLGRFYQAITSGPSLNTRIR